MVQTKVKQILNLWIQNVGIYIVPVHLTDGTSAFLPDPECVQYVQSLIPKARRRTRKRFRSKGPSNLSCRLCTLPMKLLCAMLNNLPAIDVIKMRDLLGIYLGDTYWCSRFQLDLFYEVKDIVKQKLDWEFLCMQLEHLGQFEQVKQVSDLGGEGAGLPSLYFEAPE